MFNFFGFGSNRTSSLHPTTMEDVITRLYKVPGMTNDHLRLYVDKASIYVRFKDGSGTLRLFINALKITHVYIFDRKNKCLFGGYVGWIHDRKLKHEVELIKNDNP